MRTMIHTLIGLFFGLLYAVLGLPFFFLKAWIDFTKSYLSKVQGNILYQELDTAIQGMPPEDKRRFDNLDFSNDDFFLNRVIEILAKSKDKNAAEFEARKIAANLDQQFSHTHIMARLLIRNAILSGYATPVWNYDEQKAFVVGPPIALISFSDDKDPISCALNKTGAPICAKITKS